MAEEQDGERIFPASERRLEQAREKGQVARSRELTTAAVALAAAIGLSAFGSALFGHFQVLFRSGLKLDRAAAFDPARLTPALFDLTSAAGIATLPLLAVVLVATIAAPLMLSGWLFSTHALLPDFSKIDPFKGLGNLWSKQSLVELGKALLKCALLAGIGTLMLMRAFDSLQSLAVQDTGGAVLQVGRMIDTGFFALAGGLALIALVDVPYVLWRHRDSLKMTREEVRQEMREADGDPQLKARIRSLQRAASRKRMMAAVPTASVIVTNPTHYAVALEYKEGRMRAPRVVAKGMALTALRIRSIGAEHNVPILEAPAVARALYKHAELESEIPQALYAVVARVLAYVHQVQQYRTRGGAAPVAPDNLEVPPGLDPSAPLAA